MLVWESGWGRDIEAHINTGALSSIMRNNREEGLQHLGSASAGRTPRHSPMASEEASHSRLALWDLVLTVLVQWVL